MARKTSTSKRDTPAALAERVHELDAAITASEGAMPESEKEKLGADIKKLTDRVTRKFVTVDDDEDEEPKAGGATSDDEPSTSSQARADGDGGDFDDVADMIIAAKYGFGFFVCAFLLGATAFSLL